MVSRSLEAMEGAGDLAEMVSGVVGCFFFFQAEDGIRDIGVTGVQTCALPIFHGRSRPCSAHRLSTVCSAKLAGINMAGFRRGSRGFCPAVLWFGPAAGQIPR